MARPRLRVLAALPVALVVFSPVGSAQELDPRVSIEARVVPWTIFECSDPIWNPPAICEVLAADPEITQQGFTLGLYATRAGGWPEGIGGFQFGVEHEISSPGVYWTLCSGGSEISDDDWPASGTGTAMTWAGGCQNPDGEAIFIGGFVIAGSFELPPPSGWIRLTADPRIGKALYADCTTETYEVCEENLLTWDLDELLVPACDACAATPTRAATWGELKRRFEPHVHDDLDGAGGTR